MSYSTKALSLFIYILFLISCSPKSLHTSTEKRNIYNSHQISIEDALLNLHNFIDDKTKSPLLSSVSRIKTIYREGGMSVKSSMYSPLLYVVIFDDDNGYALLAADDRASNSVYCYVEKGSFESSLLIENESDSLIIHAGIDNRFIFDEDGNMFINKEFFSSYDVESGDYYVGDYQDSVGGNLINRSFLQIVNKRIVDIAYTEVENAEIEVSDSLEIEDTFPTNPIFPTLPTPPGGGRPKYYTKVTGHYSNTIVNDLIDTNVILWHQDSPYNKYCPKVREHGSQNRVAAPCGCVPLAIAKIQNKFKTPNSLYYESIPISWSSIQSIGLSNGTDSIGYNSVAALVRKIGQDSMTLYFYEGSFTLPSLAALYLSHNGFSNVIYDWYNEDNVIQMLDASCPVFICSVPNDSGHMKFKESHAWIIDGYKKNYETITKYMELNGSTSIVGTSSNQISVSVHCDFGWGGSYNGWFISGIFDFDNPDTIFDDSATVSDSTNYNWYLRTITYDCPASTAYPQD